MRLSGRLQLAMKRPPGHCISIVASSQNFADTPDDKRPFGFYLTKSLWSLRILLSWELKRREGQVQRRKKHVESSLYWQNELL
mmetsp:Transcript_30556/g.72085  ORF Transcript_30556/g.72085 Transcript_30556/m.72085 type:complete len:83 (-) Transcript_30556:174-422(-)